MPEELLSLRMLLVGASDPERAIWAQGAARASVPIEFSTHDPDRPDVPPGGADIVVVDAGLSRVADMVQTARRLRPEPLVVLCGMRGPRLQGADGVIPSPAVVDDARRLTDLCIRARLPNRTLVVDDSATMRRIVRKILSACRFRLEVEDAADGERALREVRSGRFGLVFVDYNMPGYNGMDILKEIRRQREEVAVILMTSSIEAGIARHAMAAGAFAFLQKPFYPADIDAVLARYFGLAG